MARPGGSYVQSALSTLSKVSGTDTAQLLKYSDALVASYELQLQVSKQSMLPSFTYNLPDGTEHGMSVALDLGGSTLRVAVISLRPHKAAVTSKEEHTHEIMSVFGRRSWLVSDDVKKLPARNFFDWIAERIAIVLSSIEAHKGQGMSMGVTWSFPVEQTSAASGKIQKMGKGYTQWISIANTDLKSHFDAAFRRKGLDLRMTALINDTEATLLSHAYANPATRISLIWGTGINAAVHLPIEKVSQQKLGERPRSWIKAAKAVLVNTEVSMYGAGIFPLSEADKTLDRNSSNPGFQPLEQMTSGRYLGEIFRLIILGAVEHGELFGGHMPKGLDVPFSLDTASMNEIEDHQDPDKAAKVLEVIYAFQSRPSRNDLLVLRAIAIAISTRAATYLAVALYSLYRLERSSVESGESGESVVLPASVEGINSPVAIAYCGAVAEKHSTARMKCQEVLDHLVAHESLVTVRRRLILEAADDSGLLGAAVGAVMNANERSGIPKL